MTDTSNMTNIHNGHEFVDLGLPSGLLWATCNVGAASPEQAGLYFAWGETTGYTAEQVTAGGKKFGRASYKAKKVKGNITAKQDAAHACMGGKWRMPTKNECQELIDNCNSTWNRNYNGTGVNGYVITSKLNGNSVFFPTAGYCDGSSVDYVGSYGGYWTASWDERYIAYNLCCDLWNVYMEYTFYGFPVRAVCER